jgi:predicted RNA-binding Zn-ribbon protein involved in translation (DUF1610 family)
MVSLIDQVNEWYNNGKQMCLGCKKIVTTDTRGDGFTCPNCQRLFCFQCGEDVKSKAHTCDADNLTIEQYKKKWAIILETDSTDSKKLQEYGITVAVDSHSGEDYRILIGLGDTVLALKTKLRPKIGIDEKHIIRLMYGGRTLNDNKLLREYELHNDSKIEHSVVGVGG